MNGIVKGETPVVPRTAAMDCKFVCTFDSSRNMKAPYFSEVSVLRSIEIKFFLLVVVVCYDQSIGYGWRAE